jgi:Acetyltransferase (GNAT) family
VGEVLVATVIDWASKRNAASVHLWVTETNAHARALYERCGLTLTGERQPLPSDPSLAEVALTHPPSPNARAVFLDRGQKCPNTDQKWPRSWSTPGMSESEVTT